MVTKTQIIRCNPSVCFRDDFNNLAILYNPVDGSTFSMNEIGALIWKELKENHSTREIIQTIESKFSKVPKNAEEYVTEFIKKLIDEGLVKYDLL